MLSLAMICMGFLFCWLMYGDGLREYLSEGDGHGARVTIVAMFGSFLPFFGGAIMVLGPY